MCARCSATIARLSQPCYPCRAQVRRPNNYDMNMALMLGPTEPNPAMDLSSVEIVRTVVQVGCGRLAELRVWWLGGCACRLGRL